MIDLLNTKFSFSSCIRRGSSFIMFLALFFALAGNGKAQTAAIKTNFLYDATRSINLGMEFALSSKWTIDATYDGNFWTLPENKKWKHSIVQPELRYWLCSKFNGHFFGLHLHGGLFNVGNVDLNYRFLGTDLTKLKKYRYEGWTAGAGLGYGYSWILSRHWNFEAELGLGYAYLKYRKFECVQCGKKLGEGTHNYLGPTKAALSLIYVF